VFHKKSGICGFFAKKWIFFEKKLQKTCTVQKKAVTLRDFCEAIIDKTEHNVTELKKKSSFFNQ